MTRKITPRGRFRDGAHHKAKDDQTSLSEKHKDLLRELHEERVSALMRISGTLEALMRELHASRERLRRATGADREREVATWRDLRARAVKYRWYLEVQREALGMRRHDVLDEFYQVPSLE